jgi:PleD family two-component response regulator
VATAKWETTSAEEVIQAADKALYRAKAAGRNRIETIFAPGRRATTANSA